MTDPGFHYVSPPDHGQVILDSTHPVCLQVDLIFKDNILGLNTFLFMAHKMLLLEVFE